MISCKSMLVIFSIACIICNGYTTYSSILNNANITFVLSKPNENPVEACNRINLMPISDKIPIPWNYSQYISITTSLSFTPHQNKNGISGCCASGLWCKNVTTLSYSEIINSSYRMECFTQGYGSFTNYGWLTNDLLSYPIYACSQSALHNFSLVSLRRAKIVDETVSVYGQNFGWNNSLSIWLNKESCNDPQLCNSPLCTPCTTTESCPVGSTCIQFLSPKSPRYCMLSCAGISDLSCPCNSTCQQVSLSAQSATPYFLCAPQKPTSSNLNPCSGYLPDQLIQCSNPNINQPEYSNSSVSLSISNQLGSDSSTFHFSALSTNWCAADGDCADGNICTIDSCNNTNGYCQYTQALGCSSMIQSIRSRQAPYAYITSIETGLYSEQSLFFSRLKSKTSSSDLKSSYNSITVALPFQIIYFGNAIDEIQITGYGSINLGAEISCSNDVCILLTSDSNAIVPWYNDWSGCKVYKYHQIKGDGSNLFNIDHTAYHVLYYITESDNGNKYINSFAVSIYSDSSIRISYINASSYSLLNSVDHTYNGLWGAYSSIIQSSYNRYHKENLTFNNNSIDDNAIISGNNILFCPVSVFACIPESCVSAYDTIHIRYNATLTCYAQQETALAVACVWAGGLEKTTASVVNGLLSCMVPPLNITDGLVTYLDIVVSTDTTSNMNYDSTNYYNNDKSVFGVTRGSSGELGRTSLMIRYHNSSSSVESCGCSPLSDYSNKVCDSLGVCNGEQSTGDCANIPFGNAYYDSCGQCIGGMTGKSHKVCEDASSSSFVNLVSQTIILLMIICCMTFITSSVSYSIRRLMNRRTDAATHHHLIEMQLQQMNMIDEGNNRRGLTEFECDALGVIIFNDAFIKQQEKAMASKKDIGLKSVANESIINFSLEEGKLSQLEEKKNGNQSYICSICLSEFVEGNTCRLLPDPCGHMFHQECIDEWFKQSSACPLCKRSIKNIIQGNDEEVTLDSLPQFSALSSSNYRRQINPNRRSIGLGLTINERISRNYSPSNTTQDSNTAPSSRNNILQQQNENVLENNQDEHTDSIRLTQERFANIRPGFFGNSTYTSNYNNNGNVSNGSGLRSLGSLIDGPMNLASSNRLSAYTMVPRQPGNINEESQEAHISSSTSSPQRISSDSSMDVSHNNDAEHNL
eukprot:gene10025-13481_t